MAFDTGETVGAWTFVIDVWTYPITVLIAFINRRRQPRLVFLPFVHLLPFALVALGPR